MVFESGFTEGLKLKLPLILRIGSQLGLPILADPASMVTPRLQICTSGPAFALRFMVLTKIVSLAMHEPKVPVNTNCVLASIFALVEAPVGLATAVAGLQSILPKPLPANKKLSSLHTLKSKPAFTVYGRLVAEN